MENLRESHFDWDTDLVNLEDLLISRLPENDSALEGKDMGIFSLHELEGFFAAMHTMPELIYPSKWLQMVWGDFPPEFEDMAQAEQEIALLVRFYNETDRLLREGVFQPLWIDVDEDDQALIDALHMGGEPMPEALLPVAFWLNGYMRAFAHCSSEVIAMLDAVDSLVDRIGKGESLNKEDETLAALIGIPIRVAYALLEQIHSDAPPPLSSMDKSGAGTALESLVFLPQSLYDILESSRASQAKENMPIQGERKVGRNDPCPCGSGKKYKKCCLQ